MCGIGGIVRFDARPIDPHSAAALLETLRHRGPDDEAIASLERCTLVHTRLSVIDVAGGAQPMHRPSTAQHGPLAVIYNGMIYNHRALRRQLTDCGHRFTSDHSDTEVLLHGYAQWGTELPKHLDGFFAFAIWDQVRRELFMCRDRAGKKPLYWYRHGPELVFASVIAAVEAALSGPPPGLDERRLIDFLRLGYTFDDTLVAGITQLPAAHWMTIDGQGQTQQSRYWRPQTSVLLDSTARQSQVHDAIDGAVAQRLEADVDLGCFLSGGIDSSIVAAFAQAKLKQLGAPPLRTFTVRMPEADYDESADARRVAEHIGSQHQELAISDTSNLLEDLDHLIGCTGEPMADSSLLATYWISRAARGHVKVVLTGDGGDELFSGYDRYRAMRLLARYGRCIRRLPVAWVKPGTPRSLRTRMHRLLNAAELRTPAAQYAHMMHLFTHDQIRDLGLAVPEQDPASMPHWPSEADPVAAARQWDLEHYLPHDVLRKVDRASMTAALEVRCPLLDQRLRDLVVTAPMDQLCPRGRPKALLRRIAAHVVPSTIARRPKRGFAIPIGRWFRHRLAGLVTERLLDGTLDDLGLQRRGLKRLWHEHHGGHVDHGHRLFALLSLASWCQWRKRLSRPTGGGYTR